MSTAVDIFAGPGGWDIAARELGIEVTGIEFDAAACATRRAAGLITIEDDVRNYGPKMFEAEGLIASPPCQTFSMAGKGDGRRALDEVLQAVKVMENDLSHRIADVGEKTALVLEPLRWALQAIDLDRPYRWIALEQVPTVEPVWAAIDEVLERNGYTVFHGKLHAEQFGVPQTRTRAFLIARLDAQVRWPVPTHSRFHLREPGRLDSGVKPWVSMAEALGWGMTHRPSMTVTGGGSDTGGSEPFGNAARQGMSREIEADRWREKPEWCFNRPSTTIVSSFRPDIVAAPGYRKAGDGPRQNAPGSVRISVDEAALLQSFPVSYPWQGTKGKQFQQIGNAVPPLLAKAVLAEVLR